MAATPAIIIKGLADELITCITGLTPQGDPENFALCRRFISHNFKPYKFARTNQFDVNSKLDGLEEKFRVYNRDDLATALRTRLSELPSLTSGITPELLSLFLVLSDRPLDNTNLEDLDALIPPEKKRGLTWGDIIADDPLEGEIWKDVDFGAESSDEWSDDGVSAQQLRDEIIEERKMEEEGRKKRKSGSESEEEEEEGSRARGVEGFMVDGDKEGLEELKKAQYWNQRIKPVDEEVDVSLGFGGVDEVSIISELQAIREVLFMLLGYPCVLFQLGRKAAPDDEITVWIDIRNRFALRHSSLGVFRTILGWYAEKGTNINRIRAFAKIKTAQDSPEQQTFIAAITEKIALLDRKLVEIEQRLVSTKSSDQIVSLLALQDELDPILHPYMLLSSIAHTLTTPLAPAAQATAHLEHLFNSACTLQSVGDTHSFTFMTHIFFTCLQTYLRPIRTWMERGELRKGDEHFLVAKTQADEDVELGGLWHEQYSLRRDEQGVLQAPGFVHKAAGRIFITGKSVVFLKRLAEHGIASAEFSAETDAGSGGDMTFENVCNDKDTLAPFQDTFAHSFSRWIDALHHSVSSRLRDILYHSCGLWKSLDALETVYLCRDGFLFDYLATQVFEKVDKGVSTWGDRFLLTEMVQGVFGGVGGVEAGRLRMRGKIEVGKTLKEGRKGVGMWRGLEVDYALPWPIMNVIHKHAFDVYKSIFAFLLQIRRAKYLLKRLSLPKEDSRTFGDRGGGALYYSLKHRLLWFANTIYYYLTALVLLPQTQRMRAEMATAVDVDSIIAVHNDYINRIKEQCLLGPKLTPIHQTITTLLDLTITFSDLHFARATHAHNAGDQSMRDISVIIPRRRRRGSDPEDSDDDEDSVGGGEGQDEELDMEQETYGRRMAASSAKFNALLDFVKAGLRGVARAGVMPHLETLAEGLDGVGWGGRYG